MPTLTVYSSTSDGELYKSHAVYATAQTSPTGTARAGLTILTLGQYYADGLYGIHRMGLHIDASELPDDAVISAGVLTLYFLNKQSETFTDYDVTIIDGADLADPLVAADYGDLLDDTTAVASVVNTSAMSNNTAYDFTLTSAGRALISVTVTTKFAVRSSLDIAVTTPTGEERIYFSSAEEVTAQKPKLVITYTTSPTVTTQTCKEVVGVTATGRGNLTATGGLSVTAHGHCWATTTNPTTALTTKIDNGAASATGTFTSAITGLTPGTGYYTRAFATNSIGTSYGANVYFIASTDRAGYIWMEGDHQHGFNENAVEIININTADVDDTPVNGVTTYPISSNWAYDHENSTSAHTALLITSEVAQAFKAEYNITTDDLATYVHGIKVELTRAADIQPSSGCWFGGQFVLNAGSSGYTALDKPAYVLQAIFKGSDTSPNGTDIHVGRFETQSAGKVSDIVHILANTGTTVTGSLEYIATHIAPSVSMVNLNAQSSVTVPTGIKIMSGAGSSYNYGIDLASATINTADIRFSNSETISGLDDTPVNGATTSAISSNWAFDHEATYTAHTHALAAGATDVTATYTELNLLDLTGMTAGEVLVATAATTAVWQSTGVKLSAPDISGTVSAATTLTLPAHSINGKLTAGANEIEGSAFDIDGGDITGTTWQTHTFTLTGNLIRSGVHSLTLITTATTELTLPTSGTLATQTYANSAVTTHAGLSDPHTGYLLESLFEVHSIIYSINDDTPAQLTVGEQTLVGRITDGNITALSIAQVKTLLGAGAASGLATLGATSKVVEQPTSITDHLDGTPNEDDATKAPTSEWAFDHAALTTAHGAVSAATASKIVIRDAEGQAAFAAPAASGDALIKGTRITADELPAVTDEYYLVGTGANMEERAVPTAVATKEIFVPVMGGHFLPTLHGVYIDEADEYADTLILIPQDFSSLTALEVIFKPYNTGASMHFDITTTFAVYDGGEAYNVHSETEDGRDIGATVDQENLAHDISDLVTGLAAGDLLGVRVLYDATVIAGDGYVRGLRLKYS